MVLAAFINFILLTIMMSFYLICLLVLNFTCIICALHVIFHSTLDGGTLNEFN
jgi:hypothetical protein